MTFHIRSVHRIWTDYSDDSDDDDDDDDNDDDSSTVTVRRVLQIDVLSDVVQAVDGRCEVYLDGGIRTGTDVFKAIALGAKAVFIGRPYIYGLAYNV